MYNYCYKYRDDVIKFVLYVSYKFIKNKNEDILQASRYFDWYNKKDEEEDT